MATFDGDDRDAYLSDGVPLRPIGNGIVGYEMIAGGDCQEDLIPIYMVRNDDADAA